MQAAGSKSPGRRSELPLHRRLSAKIAFLGGASGVLLGSFTLFVAGFVGSRSLVASDRDQAVRLASVMAVMLSPSGATAEARSLSAELANKVAKIPSLEGVRLRDARGGTIAEWARASRAGEDVSSAEVPIALGDGQTGRLYVDVSRAAVEAHAERLWTVIWAMWGGAIVLSLIGGWVLGWRLGKPVEAMVAATRVVAEGRVMSGEIEVSSSDELAVLAGSFNAMNAGLRTLIDMASSVAEGDLALEIDTSGDLADAFRTMLENLRHLVQRFSETALSLNAATRQILATSKRQEEGALEQSGAVEETLRTLESLLASGVRIEEASGSLLSNAERTLEHNQLIGTRIGHLAARVEQIGEILETIKGIASKSDLLALNAALEGTKAGEAGRGFSLVASQMQRLAENVVDAVGNIKTLTKQIREATNATVLATEEGIKRAQQAAKEARQIGLIIRQQQSGIEQTTQAVNDISSVAQDTAEGATQTTVAVQDLVEMSRELQRAVEKFRLEAAA